MHINIWEALSILQRRQMTTTTSQLVARSKGGREMKGKSECQTNCVHSELIHWFSINFNFY